MRWIRDLALLLVIVAVIGGAVLHRRHQREEQELIQQVSAAVRRLETELKYRAATNSTTLNSRGWPVTIDPKWFDGKPPINHLINPHRPWVEIASTEEAGLSHPVIRMAVSDQLAQFWYNPWQGVIRARVPITVSDERTLELYNRVNGCTIASIFWKEQPTPVPEAALQEVREALAEDQDESANNVNASQPPSEATPEATPDTTPEPVAPILPHPSAVPPAKP